jgi:hypothetical protein
MFTIKVGDVKASFEENKFQKEVIFFGSCSGNAFLRV